MILLPEPLGPANTRRRSVLGILPYFGKLMRSKRFTRRLTVPFLSTITNQPSFSTIMVFRTVKASSAARLVAFLKALFMASPSALGFFRMVTFDRFVAMHSKIKRSSACGGFHCCLSPIFAPP